jgi:putative DNA primase/helicase
MLDFASKVRGRGDHPYGDDEALASLAQAFRAPAREPAEGQNEKCVVIPKAVPTTVTLDVLKYPRTEAGFADCLADTVGRNVRFDHARNRWLLWDDVRWRPDATGEVERRARDAARQVQRAANEIQDTDTRQAVFNWAVAFEYSNRLHGAISFFKTHERVASDGSEFDRDPMLLGVQNGVVDLKTGTFREGRREDHLTMSLGVAYDPQAACPRWERFLREVFDGDDDLIAFVQRAVGYTLSGSTVEQVFFLLHGLGANGKTVLLNTLAALFGAYGATADFSTFLVDKHRAGGSATPDLTALIGKRFVSARETDDGARFSASRVKTLTGSDPIAARELYGRRVFAFCPAFKCWLATNHKPIIRDDSFATWRRVRLVPFAVSFAGREDRNLETDLRSELSGILNWSLTGCRAWQRDGLGTPRAVEVATETYRVESDVLADFLDEHIVPDATAKSSAREVFGAYQRWALARGEQPMSQQGLGRALTERGFPRTKRKTGWFYDGLRVSVETIDVDAPGW